MPDITFLPYYGPNRRSDITVVEITLNFNSDDQNSFPQHTNEVRELLVTAGILTREERFPEQALPAERMAWFSSLLIQTALLLQRKTGHRVNYVSLSSMPEENRCIAVVEHEHHDVGATAVKLAYELVSGQRKLLAEPFRMFKEFARERLLPLDSGAIIRAARARDIPCVHLERQPYRREDFEHLTAGDCIRRNGLLMLGHGIHQHVLDGMFCLDKSANIKSLIGDRPQRAILLEKLGIPVSRADGYKLAGVETYHFIAVNGCVTAVIDHADGQSKPVGDFRASLVDQVLAVNREVGYAPVVVSVVAANISRPSAQTSDAVVDFTLAPDLDQYLGQLTGIGSALLRVTANAIIDWLYPANSKVHMPIIAVTGTNGKTTTTRMINHILEQANRKPGMVCTDGVFINDQKLFDGDQCTISGHMKVLTSKEADIAVLETHHAGILRRGFAFQWCDIAVCLNVTEDHLGSKNLKTVEQMAEVKNALVRRARHAAVLNADNPHCLAMLESLSVEKVCLVSMESTVDELRARVGGTSACYCVLEPVQEQQWLVIYDQGMRQPIIAVEFIPATFKGTAGFNTSNAMHAVVASYLAGIGTEVIGAAMSSFHSEYESTPGRLNVFDDLPFRIIMDFAHNPDGYRNLCEFVDQQSVSGRKLVAFAGTGDRSGETLKNMATTLAGHFDFYFCKEHVRRESDSKARHRHVAHIMQKSLLEAGVAETQTTIRTHGKEVIFEIFDACEPGDLLVMLLSHVEKHQLPGFIREYAKSVT